MPGCLDSAAATTGCAPSRSCMLAAVTLTTCVCGDVGTAVVAEEFQSVIRGQRMQRVKALLHRIPSAAGRQCALPIKRSPLEQQAGRYTFLAH